MFRYMRLYSHINMLDAAILILKSFHLQDGHYRLKVRWMLKDGSDLNQIETITVVPSQLKNWYKVIA